MRSAGQGDLGQRLAERAPAEAIELTSAFNQMAAGLEALLGAASRQRDRFMAALDSGVDAVLALNGQGQVTFANSAARHLFVRSGQEMLGRPLLWVVPDQEAVTAIRAAYSQGLRSTHAFAGPGGRHLQVIATPIAGGDDWAALVVFHDITDVKRAESVRRDFVANVSHELRTPLAAIKSVIETLSAGALEEPQVAREFLARMDAEVDRLVQMVEELLELSRLEAGEVPLVRRLVDMAALLREAVDRFTPQAQRQKLSLHLEAAEQLPPILGDAQRLEQAVVNLIHNAIKFTPAGGRILVAAAVTDGHLAVKVQDTGIGITPEELARVFERFYKANRARGGGGTGLGLALVKHAVQLHGGEVYAESQPGKGSTFTIVLPLTPSR